MKKLISSLGIVVAVGFIALGVSKINPPVTKELISKVKEPAVKDALVTKEPSLPFIIPPFPGKLPTDAVVQPSVPIPVNPTVSTVAPVAPPITPIPVAPTVLPSTDNTVVADPKNTNDVTNTTSFVQKVDVSPVTVDNDAGAETIVALKVILKDKYVSLEPLPKKHNGSLFFNSEISGDKIKILKINLKAAGFYEGDIDENYDKNTASWVGKFQKYVNNLASN